MQTDNNNRWKANEGFFHLRRTTLSQSQSKPLRIDARRIEINDDYHFKNSFAVIEPLSLA